MNFSWTPFVLVLAGQLSDFIRKREKKIKKMHKKFKILLFVPERNLKNDMVATLGFNFPFVEFIPAQWTDTWPPSTSNKPDNSLIKILCQTLWDFSHIKLLTDGKIKEHEEMNLFQQLWRFVVLLMSEYEISLFSTLQSKRGFMDFCLFISRLACHKEGHR